MSINVRVVLTLVKYCDYVKQSIIMSTAFMLILSPVNNPISISLALA